MGLSSQACKLSKENTLLTLMLMKKGSDDLAVITQSTIHLWGMPQTQIAPKIINKAQYVNMSSFVTSTSHSEPVGLVLNRG
ncbi:hypothetical protein DPMN_019121 [Dreissena polymorpha]|uniref:Uncharacterized protein n=1 Tax=Dreissena polymorpha TaxID=45954 RepID=A0A9D4S7W8_DREPO|nr:hypothetical protein DPMN_019121 [Dreissena polymorpha]